MKYCCHHEVTYIKAVGRPANPVKYNMDFEKTHRIKQKLFYEKSREMKNKEGKGDLFRERIKLDVNNWTGSNDRRILRQFEYFKIFRLQLFLTQFLRKTPT
jgi:hypothetical protein